MAPVLWRFAWRAALCAGLAAIAFGRQQATLALAVAPLAALLLARPLVDLASEARHALRRAVWRSVEGRYVVYRGVPLDVIEDADHCRWIRLADLRRILGEATSDAALARTYPGGWRAFGAVPEPYLSDEALALHLERASTPALLRFRHWVEREIAFPARRRRERFGVRLRSPRLEPLD